MSNPKVVSLQTERKGASAIPPIVNSLRQQARRQLLVLVRELLDCTDDALFEMADRSQNNADHHLYFDSMRQIRLNRSEIETQFVEHLNQSFQRVFGNATQMSADSIDEVDVDDVGLLHNDDLEISVAISGITSKITSKFSLPIMELTKRFDHLAKHATVNERRNPLGPQAVSEAFGHAIETIDVDIKIRIILLKLFERMVMQRMGPIYEEANRALADAGVLKDLRRSLGRGRNPNAATPRPPAADGRGGSASAGTGSGYATADGTHAGASDGMPGAGNGVGGGGNGGAGMEAGTGSAADFNAIQSLLAGLRGSHDSQAPPAGGVIATPQLMSLLNRVQTEASQQPVSVAELPPSLNLREVVVSRAPDVTGEAMNHLGRADEDVVNFIGMLFDYILNDRNLAIPMKALIARLQIPIVKLAILDKSFFDKSAHPARQLLNELSSAGIGWSSAAELKRDAVYDKIESVVIRVLNGFSDSPDIFNELLEELRAFRTRDTARNERIEARVKENETGRARTLAAKQEVQQVINQKACGLRLPHELGRFLSDVWSRVLLYVSLREGTGSASWESLMLTLDDVLWSLQPLDDLDQIDRRDDMRDALLDRLAAGMNLIQLSGSEQDNWCQLIRRQLEGVSENDRSYLEDDDLPRLGEQYEAMEEIILAAPHEVTDNYAGEAPAPDFVEKINLLSEGSWVEITQDDDQVLRCKLATIVKPGDRYVFVNRRGMKVAEKTRMELARELQDDKLVMLNDSQVFDRALQAVIGNLRQVQSQGVSH